MGAVGIKTLNCLESIHHDAGLQRRDDRWVAIAWSAACRVAKPTNKWGNHSGEAIVFANRSSKQCTDGTSSGDGRYTVPEEKPVRANAACATGCFMNAFHTLPLRRFSAISNEMPVSMPITSRLTQLVAGLKALAKPYLP